MWGTLLNISISRAFWTRLKGNLNDWFTPRSYDEYITYHKPQKAPRLKVPKTLQDVCVWLNDTVFCLQPLSFIQNSTYWSGSTSLCCNLSASPSDCILCELVEWPNWKYSIDNLLAEWHLLSGTHESYICQLEPIDVLNTKVMWKHSSAPTEVLIGEIQQQDWGEQHPQTSLFYNGTQTPSVTTHTGIQ